MSVGSALWQAIPSSIRDDDTRLILAILVVVSIGYMAMGGLQAFLAGESALLNAMVNSMRFILLTATAYALLTLALNLHWGYTGLFNIGIAGFMAVGTYAAYILAAPPGGRPAPGLGLPLPIAILGGVIAAAIVGGIVALPALQLDADYFAIVTVGFSEIIRLSITASTFSGTVQDPNLDTYNVVNLFGAKFGTGGGRGIRADTMRPLTTPLFEGDPAPAQPLLDLGTSVGIGPTVVKGFVYVVFLMVVFLTLYYVVSQRLGNSPFGRVLKAIREDETVAQSLGKDTRWFKIKVFMLGAAMMGLAGILWRGRTGYINPTLFRPRVTFFVFAALIIGGAGSNTGSVIGAIAFTSLLLNGPRRLGGVIGSAFGGLPSPSNFWVAFTSLDPIMYLGYIVNQISALKFIIVGAVIVWLMQNRPEGLMGHRKEIASSIDLSERPEAADRGGGPAAADGGEPDE